MEQASMASADNDSVRQGEFAAGWPVVLSALLGIGLGLSPVPFYTIGIFAPELAKSFHWGFGQIMTGIPITTLAVIIASPAVGWLSDRYGIRRVALTSIVLFSLFFMSFGLSTGSLPLFYATYGLMALFGAGTLPITFTRAVNNRFDRKKGLALGLSLVGTGLFGFVVKPFAAAAIHAFGWRTAYLAVGALPLLIALPAAIFGFHDGLPGRTGAVKAASADEKPGLTFKAAVRDWRFWLLGGAFLPVSFGVGGPIPNLENILKGDGFSPDVVVGLASLVGLAVVAGRLIGGWLIDRLWAPAVAFVLLSAPALACFALAGGVRTAPEAAGAVIMVGFAAGVEYDLMAFLVARYFGLKSYGSIYGTLYGFFALGAGIGPMVFGQAFDRTHDYAGVLKLSGVFLLLGGALLLLLGRYRRFDQGSAETLAAAEASADTLPV